MEPRRESPRRESIRHNQGHYVQEMLRAKCFLYMNAL
jgi:hypothetical protein